MKRPRKWHEDSLKNSRLTLEELVKAHQHAERIFHERKARMESSILEVEQQMAIADKRGLTEWDSEKLGKKKADKQ